MTLYSQKMAFKNQHSDANPVAHVLQLFSNYDLLDIRYLRDTAAEKILYLTSRNLASSRFKVCDFTYFVGISAGVSIDIPHPFTYST